MCKHDRCEALGPLKATAHQPSLQWLRRPLNALLDTRVATRSPGWLQTHLQTPRMKQHSAVPWNHECYQVGASGSSPRWRTPSVLLVSPLQFAHRALAPLHAREERCVRASQEETNRYNFLWFFLIYKITLFCTFSLQVSEIKKS